MQSLRVQVPRKTIDDFEVCGDVASLQLFRMYVLCYLWAVHLRLTVLVLRLNRKRESIQCSQPGNSSGLWCYASCFVDEISCTIYLLHYLPV